MWHVANSVCELKPFVRSVEIYVNEVQGGWSPFDPFVGGTEEYVIETASVLARRGYRVRVYHNGRHGEFSGVQYLDKDQYQGEDILLAVKEHPRKLARRNIFFTNDVHHRAHDFQDFDHIVAASNWHADHLLGREKVSVIYHACWPERYKNAQKIPKTCLYSSSPDRGLDFLLKIWPEVHVKTGAQLTLTYGARVNLPGVICAGKISTDEMDNLYRQSQFWLHPCTGVELFCISGYKAQAAGCIPVIIPAMALAETVVFGVKAQTENYQDALIQALQNPPRIPRIIFPSWEEVTGQLETLFT